MDLGDVKDSFGVTLVNDDGFAKAHNVILIALSSYFSESDHHQRQEQHQ